MNTTSWKVNRKFNVIEDQSNMPNRRVVNGITGKGTARDGTVQEAVAMSLTLKVRVTAL